MKQSTKEYLIDLLDQNIFKMHSELDRCVYIENIYPGEHWFFEENKEDMISQINELKDMKKELE